MHDESSLPTVLRRKLPPQLEKIRYGHYTKKDQDYPLHEYLKENDIRVDETGSEVIEFLRGKCILVTGATGFLGKLLVEKLLRCCKDIDTIYLLVRAKKGKDTRTRIKEYLDNWVFLKLSEIYPDFRNKVVGISGDFEEDGLGLTEESRHLLTEKVNIVYHVAATIRFDDTLKKSVKVNIKGTQEIIKLAKECKSFDVLTHVSSAYSNCLYKEIKEVFYPPLMDYQELIEVTDKLTSEVIDRITPGLLNGSPNTYIFTKQIAEDVIRRESVGLPTCIQRPSIVIAAVREPVRSWMDNIYGPVGLIEAATLGLLHIMWGNRNAKCHMVPADYVINNCIAASYKTAKDRLYYALSEIICSGRRVTGGLFILLIVLLALLDILDVSWLTEKVQIFNFTTTEDNPLYWKNLNFAAEQGAKVGSTLLLMKSFYAITKCWYWYMIVNFIFHTVPGHIFDFFAVRLGKKPQLTKAYEKINKFILILSHFILNEWSFTTNNTKELWTSLNQKDKSIFAFDMSTLDWHDYFDTYLVAMREFLVFEFLDNLDEGRTYQKRLYQTFYLALFVMMALAFWFCINTVFCFIPILMVAFIVYFNVAR